jgi:hypothetical protein
MEEPIISMTEKGENEPLIVFFDICSIVHCEFVPQGQTVNTKFYCEVLLRLRENIQ